MARKRHRSTDSTPSRASLAALVKRDVEAKIERARQRRAARERVPLEMVRRVPDRATRSDLKKHGFRVIPEGVVIDGPRNRKREPIPGARIKAHKGGVVSMQVKDRRDYVYGMTKKEKAAFAKGELSDKDILARLRRMFPNLRQRRVQTRLQWGSYQGTKGYTPNYFSARYFQTFQTEYVSGKARRGERKIDTLTGFHFVVHVQKKRKAKRGKGRKKK